MAPRPKLIRAETLAVTPDADAVALLEDALARVRAEEIQAAQDAERLAKEALDAETLDQSRELRQQAEDAEWRARRAHGRIPDLLARLEAARLRDLIERRKKHLARRHAVYQRMRQALAAAADAQAEAIRVDQEACADLGESDARAFLPNLVYRGLLLPDAVQTWQRWLDDAMSKLSADVAPRRVPPPTPYDPRVLLPTTSDAHRAVVMPLGPTRQDPNPPTIDTPRIVSVDPTFDNPGSRVEKREPRNDSRPLAAGEARVRVMRSGYSPADDQAACTSGDIIVMSSGVARRAAEVGAVNLLEVSDV